MRRFIEGSMAVAQAVSLCRPNVICAYPITPQTHIVENLAQMAADGSIKCEFINVESEFAAASVCLGASAAGARAFTATNSQGLMLMSEVLFNIAGLRLPIVLTCANRALSAPLSIWNDHQDSLALRDSGLIQIYVEDNQEVADAHIQAFRIAEDRRVMLPVMVCMDGFILTHSFEPVDIPSQEEIDHFLPAYDPLYYLTPKNPLTFGSFAEPDKYMEARVALHKALEESASVIVEVARDFERASGRFYGDLLQKYQSDDAEVVLVAMGSVLGTIKDVVDELRAEGKKVGCLKVRTFRPFPKEAIREALSGIPRVVVLDKDISLGAGGILATEIRDALFARQGPPIGSLIIGLGGREISKQTIRNIFERCAKEVPELDFVDLNVELMEGAIR